MNELEQMRKAYWKVRKKWEETKGQQNQLDIERDRLYSLRESQEADMDRLIHAIKIAEEIKYTSKEETLFHLNSVILPSADEIFDAHVRHGVPNPNATYVEVNQRELIKDIKLAIIETFNLRLNNLKE